jgi:reactive intermediate/imine deaminase
MLSTVSTPDAPAAIGPYSQAVRHGGLLWCSGALGLDPATGALVAGVTAQAERALRNLDAIAREAGTGLAKALRLTVYLTDLAISLRSMPSTHGGSRPPTRRAPACRWRPCPRAGWSRSMR